MASICWTQPPAPFRLHPEVELSFGRSRVFVDEQLAALVLALWDIGIETQSCCQQDYITVGGEVFASNHAYVGFAELDGARRFVGSAIEHDPNLYETAVARAATVRPGLGDGFGKGATTKTPLGELGQRWSYSLVPWRSDGSTGDPYVGFTAYVAFPRAAMASLRSAVTS